MWERYTQPASVLQVPGTVGSGEDDGVSSGARQGPFSSEGPASQAELPRLPTSPRPRGKFWCPQARCVPTAVCTALEPEGPARWSLSCQGGHLASCAVGHAFSLYRGFGAGAGQAQSGGSEPLTLPREQNTGTQGQLPAASAEGVQGLFVFHFKPRVFLFN